MQKKFLQIKQEYQNFDKKLFQKFLFTVRDTKKGIWGAADLDTVFNLFKKIKRENFKNKFSGVNKVKNNKENYKLYKQLKNKHFLDIGSGDGRVVLTASLFTQATGIEFDQNLVNQGNKIKNKLKLKANLIQGDFFQHHFSKYDILFINPDTGFYNGLEDKLLKEMKPTTKLYVYNKIFLPRFLKKGKTYWLGAAPIIVYRK